MHVTHCKYVAVHREVHLVIPFNCVQACIHICMMVCMYCMVWYSLHACRWYSAEPFMAIRVSVRRHASAIMTNTLIACVQRVTEGSGAMEDETQRPFLLQDPALLPQQLSHKAIVHSARFWHLPSKDTPKEADRKAEPLGGATEASISSPALLATCSGAARGGRGGTKAPGAEAAIKIWDVANGTHVRTLVPLEGTKYMHAVRWAPDGRHMTCAMFAPWLCVWCVHTGQIVLQLDMSADVSSVEWSHDGAWLAVGMAQGVIELVPFGR